MNRKGILTWDYLVANLSEQVAAYATLSDILIRENDILINHNASALTELTPDKDRINEKIYMLNSSFSRLISTIFMNKEESHDLTQVLKLAPPDYQDKLSQLKDHLSYLAKTIRKYNYMNEKLIENSMKYIGAMMNKIMKETHQEQKVYCNRGRLQTLGGQRNFMNIVA